MSDNMTTQIGGRDFPDTLEESLAKKILDNADAIKKARPANTPTYCVQCQDLTLDLSEGVARLLQNEADRKRKAAQFEGDIKAWAKKPANIFKVLKYGSAAIAAIAIWFHSGSAQLPQLPQTPQTPQTAQTAPVVNPQTAENAKRLERMEANFTRFETTISNLVQIVQAISP